jgi:hypothetical protein
VFIGNFESHNELRVVSTGRREYILIEVEERVPAAGSQFGVAHATLCLDVDYKNTENCQQKGEFEKVRIHSK